MAATGWGERAVAVVAALARPARAEGAIRAAPVRNAARANRSRRESASMLSLLI